MQDFLDEIKQTNNLITNSFELENVTVYVDEDNSDIFMVTERDNKIEFKFLLSGNTYILDKVDGDIKDPTKYFGDLLIGLNVQNLAAKSNFDSIKSTYIDQYGEDMTLNKRSIDATKSKLTELGYTESNVWKLMRGHNLWNTIVKPLIVSEINKKVSEGIQKQLKEGKQIDKVKVMNSMGIMTSVREYVERDFYYGDMSKFDMPKPSREKLDLLFPMN